MNFFHPANTGVFIENLVFIRFDYVYSRILLYGLFCLLFIRFYVYFVFLYLFFSVKKIP